MRLKAPLRVVLEITDRCNYNCIHCFTSSSPRTSISKELGTIQWKAILQELAKSEVFEVSFTGGEPFIRKDIFKLFRYALDLGLFITINTNGSLLNRTRIMRLSRIFGDQSQFVRIMVSLNALNQNSFFKITNTNIDPSKIINCIDTIAAEGFKVIMTTVFTKLNILEFPQLLENFLTNSSSEWNISGIIPYGRGRDCTHIELSNKDWISLIDILKKNDKVIKSRNKKVTVLCNIFLEFRNKNDLISFECPAGKTEMSIGPFGGFSPCIAFRKEVSKNSKNIMEYWRSDDFITELREFNEKKLKGKCQKCKLKTTCRGGCPALALKFFDSIYFPDPRCPFLIN